MFEKTRIWFTNFQCNELIEKMFMYLKVEYKHHSNSVRS